MRAALSFEHLSHYPCTAKELYDWHSRNGALHRLLPPWEKTSVISSDGGIQPGSEVKLQMHSGPFPFTFHARHMENIAGRMFRDEQERGPFAFWSHAHYFADTESGSTLHDKISYSLPLHHLLPQSLQNYIHNQLRRIFQYRENLLLEDIKLHMSCSSSPMRILVSGASGVLGKELLPLLSTGGHQIWTLVRRKPHPENNEIFWDPENNILNPSSLPEVDGVIHLAGEYIGLSRWSESKKLRVIDSRVNGTTLLAETLRSMVNKPKAFLCASAVGYYGNQNKRGVLETEPPGDDFISHVCHQWEEAAMPAKNAGIRTVLLRLGVGLTPRGGALQKILASSPLGFIRRFGTGEQVISWISSDDMISAMLHCLACTSLEGPVNIAAPEPTTNTRFMQILSRVAKRPLLFPISSQLLQILYGQMASEILLSGCHVSTKKLQNSGFTFRHPSLETALERLLGKEKLRSNNSA